MRKAPLYIFIVFIFLGKYCPAQQQLNNDSMVDARFLPIQPAASAPKYFPPFADRYKSRDYNYGVQHGNGRLASWRERLARWIQQLFSIPDQSASKAVNWTLNVFFVLLTISVLYFIARAFFRKEGRWIFGNTKNNAFADSNEEIVKMEAQDLRTEIAALVQAGEYRQAIRYQYIYLLRQLAEKGKITLEQDKTAHQYSLELKDEEQRRQFRYASYLYNTIWFGQYGIDDGDYALAAQHFNTVVGL